MQKTVKMGILFRGAKQPRTKAKKTTRSASPTTSRQRTRTFPFEPPPGLNLTPIQADILLYIDTTPGVPLNQWPEPVKSPRTLESMRRKGYVRCKYVPTRYYLTRSGNSLAVWLKSLREHCGKN